MDVIAALAATLRKMFLGDAFLTGGAVAVVAAVALLLRGGILPAAAAPFLLAIAVVFVLIMAINVSIYKTIRKSGK
jgi:hypothetical protein